MADSSKPPAPSQPTDDECAFGRDAWVYCAQHRRGHRTGWCSVSVRDKIGLGPLSGPHDEMFRAAQEKCRRFGLPLFDDRGPGVAP